jgi:uncharacterized cupin superfamily protein
MRTYSSYRAFTPCASPERCASYSWAACAAFRNRAADNSEISGKLTRMALNTPALDPALVEPRSTSNYPEPYRSRVLPREKRRLGDALGLTKIGVNQTRLPPGKESSMRHWHTREDEFVYVLEGEVVLRTSAGEQLLVAGTCAGFPAGSNDAHQLINRSDRVAVYLELSNRDPGDTATYTDPDVDMRWSTSDSKSVITRRDGTPY